MSVWNRQIKVVSLLGGALLVQACGVTSAPSSSSSSLTSSENSSASFSSSSASLANNSSSSSMKASSSSSAAVVSCGEALFCDDFENNSIGGQPQGGWSVSGRVAVSNEHFYSGTRAIKVDSNGYSYNRNFMSRSLADMGLAQKQLYGRMMVYLPSINESGGDFTFVQAEGQAKPGSGAPSATQAMYRARVDGRFDHMMANYETDNGWSTDCWAHPEFNENTGTPPPVEYIMPVNQWACVEWHFDAEANELMYWLNGNELDQIHVKQVGDGCVGHSQQDIWYAPQQFNQLHLGIEQYHSTSRPRTLFIDDVQLDSRYIGCPTNSASSAGTSSSTSSSVSAPQLVTGADYYGEYCIGCHGTSFGRGIRQSYVTGTSNQDLAAFITAAMPLSPQSPGDCVGQCASLIADYLKSW